MGVVSNTSLRLASGLAIQNPLAKLLAFAEEEYATYDGAETALDYEITIHDITLSVMMNSWLMALGGRSVYRARKRIGSALERIPRESSLLDECEAIPWEAIRALFDQFETIKGAKLAVATKILHKKRPGLIPILDSILLVHYRDAYPDGWEPKIGLVAVRAIELFRYDLLSVRDRTEALVSDLAERGFPLTPVRALEALMWIECSKAEVYCSARPGSG